jgi:hypothetical protein
MRNTRHPVLFSTLLFVFGLASAEARDGQRDGGVAAGRDGGRAQASVPHTQANVARTPSNISRTPSMSRAQPWTPPAPIRPNVQASREPKLLPSSHPRMAGTSVERGNASKAQLQQFLHQHATNARVNLRNQNDLQALKTHFEKNSDAPIENARTAFQNKLQNRQQSGNRLRQDFARDNRDSRHWFDNNFWGNHHYRPNYWQSSHNWWWKHQSWQALNGWLALEDAYPLYYEGGYPIDFSSYNEGAYWNAPENAEYYSSEQVEPFDANWMPLGIFGLTNEENADEQPIIYFQLVMNREGTIEGVYYNQETDETYQIEGTGDRSTQRAAWRIANTDFPIFATGLYNLTLPETPVDVYFTADNIQNWLMIHL